MGSCRSRLRRATGRSRIFRPGVCRGRVPTTSSETPIRRGPSRSASPTRVPSVSTWSPISTRVLSMSTRSPFPRRWSRTPRCRGSCSTSWSGRCEKRHRATAAEYRLIRLLLDRAAADPVPWAGPDPTLDLAWSDTRGRTVAAVRRDRCDVAERAAIAELATRLRLSEQTVRARAARAEVLQTRCPDVWGAFTEGNISERHAVEAARLATSLPDAEDTPVAEPVASPDEAGLIAGDVEPADDDGDAGDHGSPSNSARDGVRLSTQRARVVARVRRGCARPRDPAASRTLRHRRALAAR